MRWYDYYGRERLTVQVRKNTCERSERKCHWPPLVHLNFLEGVCVGGGVNFASFLIENTTDEGPWDARTTGGGMPCPVLINTAGN